VTHFTSSRFWSCYEQLTEEVRAQADKQFALLKANPSHPLLRFKKVGKILVRSRQCRGARVGGRDGNDLVWFWIGDHVNTNASSREADRSW